MKKTCLQAMAGDMKLFTDQWAEDRKRLTDKVEEGRKLCADHRRLFADQLAAERQSFDQRMKTLSDESAGITQKLLAVNKKLESLGAIGEKAEISELIG